MRWTLLILIISIVSAEGKGIIVPNDLKKRYYNVATKIEEYVLEDHEYYMTSQIKSYDLQSVLKTDEELLSLLNNVEVLDKDLKKLGNLVLQKIKESQVEKKMKIPQSIPKSKITYNYFSSVN